MTSKRDKHICVNDEVRLMFFVKELDMSFIPKYLK